jgi:hypothetical protein
VLRAISPTVAYRAVSPEVIILRGVLPMSMGVAVKETDPAVVGVMLAEAGENLRCQRNISPSLAYSSLLSFSRE